MAEMTARLGLDDRSFRSTLNRSVGESSRAAARMDSDWTRASGKIGKEVIKGFGAFKGTQAAIQGARAAVDDYGKRFTFAAREQERFDASTKKLTQSIGRDLHHALVGSTGMLESWVGWLERARTGAVDRVANILANPLGGLFGEGQAQEVGAARAAAEAQDREIRQRQRFGVLASEGRQGINESLDSPEARAYAAIEAERRLHEEKKRAIAAESKSGAVSRDQAAQLEQLEKTRHGAKLGQIEREKQAALQAAKDRELAEATRADEEGRRAAEKEADERRRRSDRLAELRFEEQQNAIEDLRLAGGEKEAELARIRLGVERDIHAIGQDELLTQEERNRAADEAMQRGVRLTAIAEERFRRGEGTGELRVGGSVGGGLAGTPGLMAQALGGASRPQLEETRKQSRILEEIRTVLRDKLGAGTVAVAQ
jgi:hypothetical protein